MTPYPQAVIDAGRTILEDTWPGLSISDELVGVVYEAMSAAMEEHDRAEYAKYFAETKKIKVSFGTSPRLQRLNDIHGPL